MSSANSETQINFRLTLSQKETIEDAATEMGQTVSDFAVATLIQAARKVLNDQHVTLLSERDRKVFAAIVDDETTQPNDAILKAVERYGKQVG
ncbi:MAG: DUF1778 domain-containing protein [Planctomycetaceae bacterium]|jgi:uncharacterized protein (DUF1778 family)